LASAGAQESAPPSFNRYSFNVGGGLGIGKGYVANFVGNSWQGTAGAGINFNRLFGVEAEYMIYDLKLRPSVSNEPGLAGSTGHLQAISLDGVVKVPRRLWKFGAYGIFGIGFDDRSVSVEHSQFLPNGTTCQQPYERWWGINCVSYNPQIPYGTVSGPTPPGGETLGSYSKVAGSYDYGGGITYKPESWRRAKIYLEYRHHHAYQSDAETIVQPISVGVRW
jgi:hypothetical protein